MGPSGGNMTGPWGVTRSEALFPGVYWYVLQCPFGKVISSFWIQIHGENQDWVLFPGRKHMSLKFSVKRQRF